LRDCRLHSFTFRCAHSLTLSPVPDSARRLDRGWHPCLVPECSKSYEDASARQPQMHSFGELDGHAKPVDPDPLVGGQDLGPKSGLSRGAGTDGAGRLHQNRRDQHAAQDAHRASARARYCEGARGVETARAQRKPKYPKTNRTMTTAPTSQMMLFMILLCCLL